MQVFRLQHSVHTHHHTRAPVPVRSPVVLAPPQQCRRVAVAAKKRKLNRDYEFVEVYQGVIAKLRERNHLSVRDMTQLIECIKTVEEVSLKEGNEAMSPRRGGLDTTHVSLRVHLDH